jgi:hypothetical protein
MLESTEWGKVGSDCSGPRDKAPKPYLEDAGKYHGIFRAALLLGVVVMCLIFLAGVYQVGAWITRAL